MPTKRVGAKKRKSVLVGCKKMEKNKPTVSIKKNKPQKKLIKQPSEKIKVDNAAFTSAGPHVEMKCTQTGSSYKFYSYTFIIFSFLIGISLIICIPSVCGFYSDYEMRMLKLDGQASLMGSKYGQKLPAGWGEFLPGIITHFYTNKKELVLTLDACGGKKGSHVDIKLINFLIDNKIKATLFVNARWVARNKDILLVMASSGLFDIENHGLSHHPLSVTPQTIYGIKGTGSPESVVYEVELGAMAIKNTVGGNPLYFRSGTAYYDDVSLNILKDLGYTAVAFSVNADEGATLAARAVYEKMMKATSGDIIIAHMNRPDNGTAAGIMEALPALVGAGYSFLKLTEVN